MAMEINKDWKHAETKMKNFWRPGDEIICTRIFRSSNNECYLCGHTPIEWHHVLLHSISNEIIDVEFSCVINMKKMLEEWGSDQKILFFPKYSDEANHINSEYAGTASMVEFNSNIEVIIELMSHPERLSYKQVKSILDHTTKFKEGVEVELFHEALDIYVARNYYLYDMLDECDKSGNVEQSIENYFRKEWEDAQCGEEEYQQATYRTFLSDENGDVDQYLNRNGHRCENEDAPF